MHHDTLLRILATYRVARMIAYEGGPADVLVSLRTWADRYPHLASGIHCPLCLSFWFALVMSIAPRWVAHWLGIAGAAVVIHQIIDEVEIDDNEPLAY
jgi:hypothetical protein